VFVVRVEQVYRFRSFHDDVGTCEMAAINSEIVGVEGWRLKGGIYISINRGLGTRGSGHCTRVGATREERKKKRKIRRKNTCVQNSI